MYGKKNVSKFLKKDKYKKEGLLMSLKDILRVFAGV
jgi:hypothetical protein